MDGFPFACPVEVRFSDVDAMNHVNNAVFVTFLELARLRLFQERLGFSGTAREIPIIVARVSVDYRSPVGLDDRVVIGVGVTSVGRTSFTLAFRVEASGRLAAEAETVQVYYDYAVRKPIAIVGEFRARLESLRLPG